MKKSLQYFIVFVFCFAFHTSLFVSDLQAQESGAKCSRAKFTALNKYKGDDWSKIFVDRQVAPVLKTILKSDFAKLKSGLAQADYPDSLSFVDENGVLTLEGAAPGLYTITEAKLIVEPCGNIYAAVLDQGKNILYFTNDRQNLAKLPSLIEDWRANLEKRRRQSSSAKIVDLPVVFKNK